MGSVGVHQAHTRLAERTPAGEDRHPSARHADPGPGIRVFHNALPSGREDRPLKRHLAAPRAAAPERASDCRERWRMTSPVVGFAGMTHLGLVSASAVAARGFELVCFDPDRALIDRLAGQAIPLLPPALTH